MSETTNTAAATDPAQMSGEKNAAPSQTSPEAAAASGPESEPPRSDAAAGMGMPDNEPDNGAAQVESNTIASEVPNDKVVKGPGQANINLVLRIPVKVEVVLGTARMTIAELMQLGPGSVVQLDRHVGEPIDVMVNGRLVARGEVVVDENDETRLGIRLTEIVEPGTFC